MKRKAVPNRAILLIIIALLFLVVDYYRDKLTLDQAVNIDNSSIEQAYEQKKQSFQVTGSGTVIKILPDDLKGSKHQKFILRVTEDLTILIAHNIDLAPRINNLEKGDRVNFSGEYEYNSRGGVVHWTHHDPKKKHPEGWLKHEGNIYK